MKTTNSPMPDLLTPAELAAVREREAKATPGPWVVSPAKDDDDWPRLMWDNPNDPREDLREQPHITDLDDGIYVYDMDFIAHARADIPALLRHIAALEARTPAPALPADMEALLAEAENAVANERRWLEAQKPERDLTSRLATALRESRAREVAEESARVEAEREFGEMRNNILKAADDIDLWRSRAKRETDLRLKYEEETNRVRAERDAAIARAEKAEAELDDLTQTTGELCPECHWRGVRDDGCEFCKAHRLEADLAAARKELAGLGPVEREQASPNIDMWWPERVTDLECRTNRRRAIRRVLEGGAQ